jgi:hypothetical protein
MFGLGRAFLGAVELPAIVLSSKVPEFREFLSGFGGQERSNQDFVLVDVKVNFLADSNGQPGRDGTRKLESVQKSKQLGVDPRWIVRRLPNLNQILAVQDSLNDKVFLQGNDGIENLSTRQKSC